MAVALSLLHGFAVEDFPRLLASVVPNLIGSLLAFIALYFVLERVGIIGGLQTRSIMTLENIKDFYLRHDEMDWGDIIAQAKTLDIVAFYYGRWVRNNFDAFVTFFRNGGRVRLIMSDPQDVHMMKIVWEQFFDDLGSIDELRQKIVATTSLLEDALEQSGSKVASIDVHYFPDILHYSFVLVNERSLYLSFYEQFRGPNLRSPVVAIDITSDPKLEEYWKMTLESFITKSAGTERESSSPVDT